MNVEVQKLSIPYFNSRGLLPAGDYSATFEQLKNSVLVRGTPEFELDGPWRLPLIEQVEPCAPGSGRHQ